MTSQGAKDSDAIAGQRQYSGARQNHHRNRSTGTLHGILKKSSSPDHWTKVANHGLPEDTERSNTGRTCTTRTCSTAGSELYNEICFHDDDSTVYMDDIKICIGDAQSSNDAKGAEKKKKKKSSKKKKGKRKSKSKPLEPKGVHNGVVDVEKQNGKENELKRSNMNSDSTVGSEKKKKNSKREMDDRNATISSTRKEKKKKNSKRDIDDRNATISSTRKEKKKKNSKRDIDDGTSRTSATTVSQRKIKSDPEPSFHTEATLCDDLGKRRESGRSTPPDPPSYQDRPMAEISYNDTSIDDDTTLYQFTVFEERSHQLGKPLLKSTSKTAEKSTGPKPKILGRDGRRRFWLTLFPNRG